MPWDHNNPPIGGNTYNPEQDGPRLGHQTLAVLELMRDAQWRTLKEISATLNYPEGSVSARLRDFRKDKFGGHTVERRLRDVTGEHRGTWEYRLLLNGIHPADRFNVLPGID